MPTHVNSLPVEILGEIFTYALPDVPQFARDTSPLVLTHVSRYWRRVATSTRALWASVNVTRKQGKNGDLGQLLQFWLENSGCHPLELRLDLLGGEDVVLCVDEYNEHRRAYRTSATTLRPHLPRLEFFDARLPSSAANSWSFDEMSNLKELHLRGITEMTMGAPKPLTWSNSLPQLRKLTIQQLPCPRDALLSPSRIVHLELTGLGDPGRISAEWSLKMFESMPHLEVCAIEITLEGEVEYWNRQGPAQTFVSLPVLEKLFVAWDGSANVGELLERVVCPKLDRLCLRGTPQTGGTSWQALHTFLEQSQPNIRYLSLNDMSDVSIRLLDCLKLCSNLRRLTINHASVGNLLLTALAANDVGSEEILLPKLNRLQLGACHDFEASSVLDMVLRRVSIAREHPNVTPLCRIEFLYCNGLIMDYSDGYLGDITAIIDDVANELELIVENGECFPAPFGMGILPFMRVVESHERFLANDLSC